MSIRDTEEREWELSKQLDEIKNQRAEFDIIGKELTDLEEGCYWQNKQTKEVNDLLFEGYPNDARLQSLLQEKEELLQKKIAYEKAVWEECSDIINEKRKQAESLMEEYERELTLLHENRK